MITIVIYDCRNDVPFRLYSQYLYPKNFPLPDLFWLQNYPMVIQLKTLLWYSLLYGLSHE